MLALSSALKSLLCLCLLFSGYVSGDNLNIPIGITFPASISTKLVAGIQGSISLGYIPQKLWHTNDAKPKVVGLINPAEIDFLSGVGSMRPDFARFGIMNLVGDDSIPDSSAEGQELSVNDLAFISTRLAGASLQGKDVASVKLRISYPMYVDFFGEDKVHSGVRLHVGAPTCALSSSSVPNKMAYCDRGPLFSRDRGALMAGENGVERVYYDVWYKKNPYSEYDDGLWIILGNDPVREGFMDRRGGTYLTVAPGARSGFYRSQFQVYVKVV